ncbi:hypothetical protein [Lentzea sp. NPDC051838]|uniref:hypothetical protein n=1 Tax=Lentzea sp. NPDC051838 TaxID=3154849 RepID=UPI00342C9FF4
MGRNALMRAFVTTVAAAAAFALAGTASAATDSDEQSKVYRDRVLRIGTIDSRPEVRSAAWAALTSSRGTVAVKEFLTTGVYAARQKAVDNARRNKDYIIRVNRSAVPNSAVANSSSRMLDASTTDEQRVKYVQTGLAEAQELDRVNNNRDQEKFAEQAQADRDYVTQLAAHDPGPQVRDAASRAVAAGTDYDIGLFFKYHWASAAALDQEAFRRFVADQDAIWLVRINVLIEAAQAAEKAERESSGEFARKARLEAIGHWRTIQTESNGSSVNWEGERDNADAQATSWAAIVAHARAAATGQDWASVITRGTDAGKAWSDHADWAVAQASAWKSIAERARESAEAAENRDLGDR